MPDNEVDTVFVIIKRSDRPFMLTVQGRARLRHQGRKIRSSSDQKRAQPVLVIIRRGRCNGWSLCKRFAPRTYFGLAVEDSEVADLIKRIEIAKRRAEYDVD